MPENDSPCLTVGEEDLGLGIAVETQMGAMPFSLPRIHVPPL